MIPIICSLCVYTLLQYFLLQIFIKLKSSKCIDKDAMERKFFKSGNGWALFVPKTILELLKINPQTDKIEMQVENDVLKIKKIDKT